MDKQWRSAGYTGFPDSGFLDKNGEEFGEGAALDSDEPTISLLGQGV